MFGMGSEGWALTAEFVGGCTNAGPRRIHYCIVMPPHIGATRILRPTLGWLKEDKAMQADRARLTKASALRRSSP